MSALNWKPFVYGGLASITAECGLPPRCYARHPMAPSR
ncbi:SLC25A30 isoform 8 [Pongo abelii]|uniref:Solute carrier family 25 member 30 n=2 Tax=Hominidae TaxID=9604 RepID=D6RJI0_HUMAN|nr:SLC25A30 isoform 4 [Pongo abelii]PNJ60524.1 SLC25A30 isoform 8 [Pongo abelii]